MLYKCVKCVDEMYKDYFNNVWEMLYKCVKCVDEMYKDYFNNAGEMLYKCSEYNVLRQRQQCMKNVFEMCYTCFTNAC